MRKPCPCMYMTVEPEAALKVKILDQSPSETLAFELWKNSFCTGLFSWWISPCQEFYGGPKLISAWPLQLRSLATFNRSVQNISESLLKLHTVTPPKKRKDIQRYMFPKLVSLGIILGPPLSPAGGLSEFSLHLGPREPFGHAVKAAAAFVEAPRLQTCRSGTTPGPRSGCQEERSRIRWNFHNGIHFLFLFSKMGRILGGLPEPASSVERGGVVQLILRGAVRRPKKKKNGSKYMPEFWRSISAKLQRIPEFRKSFLSARWMDFQFKHRKMFSKRQLVCFDKADLIKRKLKIHEMFDSERCIFKNKIYDLFNTNEYQPVIYSCQLAIWIRISWFFFWRFPLLN